MRITVDRLLNEQRAFVSCGSFLALRFFLSLSVFFSLYSRWAKACYHLCDGTSKIAPVAESWIYHQNIFPNRMCAFTYILFVIYGFENILCDCAFCLRLLNGTVLFSFYLNYGFWGLPRVRVVELKHLAYWITASPLLLHSHSLCLCVW